MPHLTVALIATGLLVTAALPAVAQEEEVYADIETIHGDADGFFELFGTLQDAVMLGDPVTTMAENALYPLTINANGETYDIIDEADFIDNYDTLVTPETEEALVEQNPADLIVTQDGVGIGNGALWITNVCLDDACEATQWGILSINN